MQLSEVVFCPLELQGPFRVMRTSWDGVSMVQGIREF